MVPCWQLTSSAACRSAEDPRPASPLLADGELAVLRNRAGVQCAAAGDVLARAAGGARELRGRLQLIDALS